MSKRVNNKRGNKLRKGVTRLKQTAASAQCSKVRAHWGTRALDTSTQGRMKFEKLIWRGLINPDWRKSKEDSNGKDTKDGR